MHEIEETDRLTEPEKNLKGKRIENVNFSLTPACLSPFHRRETVYGALQMSVPLFEEWLYDLPIFSYPAPNRRWEQRILGVKIFRSTTKSLKMLHKQVINCAWIRAANVNFKTVLWSHFQSG